MHTMGLSCTVMAQKTDVVLLAFSVMLNKVITTTVIRPLDDPT